MSWRIYFIMFFSCVCLSCSTDNSKNYRMGFYGPIDQRPIIEAEQSINGVKYLIGTNFISTSKNSSLTPKSKYSCHLGIVACQKDNLGTKFFLTVQVAASHYELKIPSNSVLLIKLYNGEVLKLRCEGVFPYRNSKVFSLNLKDKQLKYSAKYPIDIQSLKNLRNGIKKIRLQINSEFVDYYFRRYHDDEVGEYLYNEYLLMCIRENKYFHFEREF